MKHKFREWFSIQLSKNPRFMLLCGILAFNVVFFFLAALIISALSLTGTEKMGFLQAAFCTITMILDAGCVQFVIEDIGTAGVVTSLACLLVILVGMISFTGAVIGYVTNFISNFIENANTGSSKLHTSGHVVILNWNTRASEIVNDLLYCHTKQTVVVLVAGRKEEIKKEIDERLSDTVTRENESILADCVDMKRLERFSYMRKHKFRKNITVIVREGDVFSSKQLRDISLEKAKTVIILGNDINNTICKFEHLELAEEMAKGNSLTIKTLMQVADITAAETSADDQRIIVEITDDWTAEIVDKIIRWKQVDGKCNIVPLHVNQVLGQILSQFSLMPELNMVYQELFSNKGAAFYCTEGSSEDEVAYISDYLSNHKHALPLTFMESGGEMCFYYASENEKDLGRASSVVKSNYQVKLNHEYRIESKNVIILGHNSKCRDIMKGFSSFVSEWGYQGGEILRIVVIDDPKNLDKMNHYQEYPFVIETVEAEIYDKELIYSTIDRVVSGNEGDTSILILSDDAALNESVDANALANLVYVQDIINNKMKVNSDFDPESIDVVVEIIDPKHHDIVSSYSVNNIVISNRYISKMITQIGEKEDLYNFYCDILTYDADGEDGIYDSKEIYTKKVTRLFHEVPEPCKADEFIRAVYAASTDENLPPEQQNPNMALGYVKPGGKMVLFKGDQSTIDVKLDEKDKLIVFSNH